ncbi:WD40/YVTN repeat-like-containing domain protein [Niveomyces insectorum RCEF 264]|uniref:WD40/YVTN repeat-like-containing domain protein n=1 Tax=Niveomyces insectorum RCEF 264 TaxID=1081102 RepID=A0A167Y3J9_9HYPO|nr:WD40/YVTN repeat-like-containing domain protein [Niveomyces insectorum RCEF 264]
MFSQFLLTSSVFMALTQVATPFPHSSNSDKGCQNGRAIYMISNNADNAVVAVPIASDGTLLVDRGTTTATGGVGETGITKATNQSAGPDGLFSQSSLTIAGNNIFAVNPGSNTVSMFAIDQRDPTKLTLVGNPAALLGDFPVTVAASDQNRLVCVGASGARAGVSCASFSAQTGIGAMDGLRSFALNQTTPPEGPLNTVSEVFFSGDESTLFTTVKGDPTVNNTGFLASFPVQNARTTCRAASVGKQATRNSPNGTAVLFGSKPIPGSSNLFVTDASFGAAVLGISSAADIAAGEPGVVTLGRGVIDGQSATCWATISPATNTAFVTDVGVNRLVEMSLTDASIQGQPIDLSANGDPGLIDLVAAGSFIYALSPGNGTTEAAVTVLNALTRAQVQHAQLTSLGLNKNAQGLAVLV